MLVLWIRRDDFSKRASGQSALPECSRPGRPCVQRKASERRNETRREAGRERGAARNVKHAEQS
ncbi:hypothetical protein PGR6_20950 [Pseudomonas sp. GR 6-02]|nr:hypothetical protein PGR6_20950 [Pseudomonas sp. GR 6-02]